MLDGTSVGQNAYMSMSSQVSSEEMMMTMDNEVTDPGFDPADIQPFKFGYGTGHYTQAWLFGQKRLKLDVDGHIIARVDGSEALLCATMPRRATTSGRPCTRWANRAPNVPLERFAGTRTNSASSHKNVEDIDAKMINDAIQRSYQLQPLIVI